MKATRKVKVVVVVGSVLVLTLTCVAWYFSPSKVEGMDRMLYCACGYSKVQFKDGVITMVEYHHDTVKPGDVIGRYTANSQDVELEIYFGGKTNIARFKTDHIGILASPEGGIWRYQALPGDSLKVSVWRLLHKTS